MSTQEEASKLSDSPLFKRVAFTVLALLVFRLGVHIPTPGVNTKALVLLAAEQSGGLLKVLNMFSGGALERFSIFALGVMPYISASIIIQLMTVVVPALEQMQKEGGVGRQKINRITRALAMVLAVIQGFVFSSGLQALPETAAGPAVLTSGISFQVLSAVTLCAGTAFVIWLGEQITEKGIGNGISLIIFAGIVAGFPAGMATVIRGLQDGSIGVFGALAIAFIVVAIVAGIAFIEQSYRKIAIQYAKRIVGRRVLQAQGTHLPLKVNMAGVIPSIFASTLLAIPVSLVGFSAQTSNIWLSELYPNRWLYNVFFVVLVGFFCYFYTSITFKPDDIAENLKRQNAYIPGIRPGKETSEALDQVVTRLTLAGAVYMNLVIIAPVLVTTTFAGQVQFGGTSVLIVVGVALETIRQVTAQMATQKYDELIFKDPSPGSGGGMSSSENPRPALT